jgi:hypothetical protein
MKQLPAITAAVILSVIVLAFFSSRDHRTAGERIDDEARPATTIRTPAPPALTPPIPSPAPRALSPEETRNELADMYLALVSNANKYMNFIKKRTTKTKGGYELWAVHSGFTSRSFDYGDEAKLISAWIDSNRTELKRAGIVRVGLKNESGYLGSCWYDLNKN